MTCSCCLRLSEERLVVDESVDSFDQVFVAQGHLLDTTSSIVPGHSFDVELLEELKFDIVVVCVVVLLSESIRDQRLHVSLVLSTDNLHCVFSHGARTSLRSIRCKLFACHAAIMRLIVERSGCLC